MDIYKDFLREVERCFNGKDARFVRRPDGALLIDWYCDGDEKEADRVAKKARRFLGLSKLLEMGEV